MLNPLPCERGIAQVCQNTSDDFVALVRASVALVNSIWSVGSNLGGWRQCQVDTINPKTLLTRVTRAYSLHQRLGLMFALTPR
jgi:hypothetical protein